MITIKYVKTISVGQLKGIKFRETMKVADIPAAKSWVSSVNSRADRVGYSVSDVVVVGSKKR
jgi:hypothetical protein